MTLILWPRPSWVQFSRWLCLKNSCHANSQHCCIRREGRGEESDLKKSRQMSSKVTQYVDLLLPCCSSYRLVCIREWLVSIHLTLTLQHQSEAFIQESNLLCSSSWHPLKSLLQDVLRKTVHGYWPAVATYPMRAV